jgi:hypothetical protein
VEERSDVLTISLGFPEANNRLRDGVGMLLGRMGRVQLMSAGNPPLSQCPGSQGDS